MKIRACLSLVALLAGCGGNVIVDSATTEPAELTCADLCDAVEAACPSQATACASSCALLDEVGNEACAESYQPMLACVVDSAAQSTFCGQSAACMAELTAFATCISNACETNPSSCQP